LPLHKRAAPYNLNIQAEDLPETSIKFYNTTSRHTPDDSNHYGRLKTSNVAQALGTNAIRRTVPQIGVFRVFTPHSLVGRYQCFVGISCTHLQGLRHFGIYL